ncbi:putative levansucrase [Helianthus anomalus]
MSKRPQKILNTPPSQPTPPHQPTPPQSPIHQSPPRQPTPPQSPKQPTPPSHSTPPRLPTPQRTPSPNPQSTPPQQPMYSSHDLFATPPLSQVQQPELTSKGLYTPQDNLLDIGSFDFANNSEVLKLEKKMESVIAENQRLRVENKKAADRERALVKRVEVLEKKSEADQSEIDILKVRVSELEEEKSRRDAQNEYFELKHKELNEAKRAKDHELYMLHKVVESMLGSSVEERYEEIQLAEVRADRKAEIDRQMKDKGKSLEGSSATPILDIIPVMDVENPQPISAISGLFEEPTSLHELIGASSEEEDDEDEEDKKEDDKDDFVFSASSHSSQNDDDDDATGGTGVRVTDASNEKVVDDLMNDTVNEENDESDGKGESDQNQIVEHYEPLFLNLDVYKKSLKDVNPETPFDFEEELESFDINKQNDYKYNYVEDADQYDRVEVEECSDTEESRQKVTEAVKDNVFEGLRKETEPESQSDVAKEGQSSSEEIDRSKWFKVSHERKFKRPLKYFQRDRSVSLGDIISWGFLPQVNAYAIRREYGVQYFQRLYDIMSLPWWDVDELSQVRTLEYPVRQNDKAIWGYIKYETLRGYLKWKPHRPRRVERVNPETGMRETILNVKPPRTLTTIPMPEMEQDFYKGFIDWVYSCLTTEAIITYRAGSELRYIHIYDPMWLVNCSAKDIECLFIHKIRYKAEDIDQAQQFQCVVSLCFQKGINSESKWKSSWWELNERMKEKAKR